MFELIIPTAIAIAFIYILGRHFYGGRNANL